MESGPGTPVPLPPGSLDRADIAKLVEQLLSLRTSMLRLEATFDLTAIHPKQRASARNILDYVALRQQDLRTLQDQLTQWGLSSLGRCEAHVRDNVEVVLSLLHQLVPEALPAEPAAENSLTYRDGMTLIEQRTSELFGERLTNRAAHIMVTMPSEAADDYALVRDLVKHGMSCMRINCSHDGPLAWERMIENLKRAKRESGRDCRVVMDLGGPKLRTSPLLPGISSIQLPRGSQLLITRTARPGKPLVFSPECDVGSLPHIGCTLDEIFRDARPDERILFDDGKIGGVIREVYPDHLLVEITQARGKGAKLRGDKGINLPDSRLKLAALTEKDMRDLDFIVQHADMVSYSFVRHPDDVHKLQSELKRLGRPSMPIMLKIENREAFERLPSLLLAAMKGPLAAVMIARGDLAVEVGYERLAEVQEEILWICEAAHMPVVWATQVLEQLAKKGTPSRAEVTDAAMSVRAECVMLNKGPFILDAVRTLDDILRRMQDHQSKKRPKLRRLKLADDIPLKRNHVQLDSV